MRGPQSAAFLNEIGWGQATRCFLAGDASARAYERVSLGHKKAVLMDAPLGCGDDIGDFAKIARHLRGLGLSAPEIYAMDEAAGFMLIEDLGDGIFARLFERGAAPELALYRAAAEVLLTLQSAAAPLGLADLTAGQWASSVDMAAEYYAFGITGVKPDPSAMIAALKQALLSYADGPRVLILRDFHAENMLWLPERQGLARIGLLDFQLGQMGQPEYDLVSMLQDARRDVSLDVETAVLQHFAAQSGKGQAQTSAAYATLGAMRALRVLGIFARLSMVARKDRYLEFLPRVWGQLARNLSHPVLADLAAAVYAILPAPDDVAIARIKACQSPCL